MSDKFTSDLQFRLNEFIENISFERLSEAFERANFQGYKHLKNIGLGIGDVGFQDAQFAATTSINAGFGTPLAALLMGVTHIHIAEKAADHQDLALAA